MCTYQEIQNLKQQIETHRTALDSIELELEVDLVYDTLRTLVRMGARDSVVEVWIKDIQQEIIQIKDILKQIESKKE